MKFHLWSVGKAHEGYVKTGIEDFTRRIGKYFPVDWKLISPAKQTSGSSANEVKKNEAASVLASLSKDDFLILLDERGTQLSSTELADKIQQLGNASVKNLIFLIGGAFGVDDSIAKRANFTWALSKLVFPHQLVRLVLSEQLYRACTIIRNEKYHHL